jgi:uncharacterized membrane protein YkvA (DUF1232 family)
LPWGESRLRQGDFFRVDDEQFFMRLAQMFTLMNDAQLSTEQLGKRLGISGMTLRRWRHESGDRELPTLYAKALESVICELAAEGKLKKESAMVQTAMSKIQHAPYATIGANLGIQWDQLKPGPFSEQRLVECLSQIGSHVDHQREVALKTHHILSFRKWGLEWNSRISLLMKILKSEELNVFDKYVAYGALFYLITEIDLIPNDLPVFGYMDEYVLLWFAENYYAKRSPHLLGNGYE